MLETCVGRNVGVLLNLVDLAIELSGDDNFVGDSKHSDTNVIAEVSL